MLDKHRGIFDLFSEKNGLNLNEFRMGMVLSKGQVGAFCAYNRNLQDRVDTTAYRYSFGCHLGWVHFRGIRSG